jgi:hypothetical protein
MDWALLTAVIIFVVLAATVLLVNYLLSRKGKRPKREVGYQRPAIEIDPGAVPEFKPTWRHLR